MPLEVEITGQWVSGYPNTTWKGTARASEPILSVCMVQCGDRTEWAKTPLTNYTSLDLDLNLHYRRREGCDVQFLYFLGQAWVQEATATVPSQDYRPEILAQRRVRTGELVELAAVTSTPVVRVLALFLEKREVRVGRKRIWRVRPELLAGFAPPLRGILGGGRTGVADQSFANEF